MRDPSQLDWRFERATLLECRGEWEAARQEIDRVLRDRPDWPAARELHGRVLHAATKPAR